MKRRNTEDKVEVSTARFCIGEIVKHKLFDYYGVIYNVDPVFTGTDEWYETVAKSRPPKDQPWYHVLVDGRGATTTYVAERNLQHCTEFKRINHPLIDVYFSGHDGKSYLMKSMT